MDGEDLHPYLGPSAGVRCDSGKVRALSADLARGAHTVQEKAAALFAFVRDTVRYVPYAPFQRIEDYEAEATLDRGYGFCTQKSSLLVAMARAAAIPARFHYADLVNRAMPGRLESVLQSDRMVYHTYVDLHVGGRWMKVTPSFERDLCQKMGWHLVEFDGTADATFRPLDLQGMPHIDYILDRGTDAGIPLPSMIHAWEQEYGAEALDRWNEATAQIAARSSFKGV